MKINPKNKKFLSYLLFWRHSSEDIQDQIKNYDSLSIIYSWKGISTLWVLFDVIAIGVLTYLGTEFDILNYTVNLIIYFIASFFIYKGNRLFISLAILSGILGLLDNFTGSRIFILAIRLYFLIGAFKVESLRRKQKKYQAEERVKTHKTKVANSIETKSKRSVNLTISHKFILLIIIGISFASTLFYWYEIKPMRIRSKCSWIEKHSDAVPAKPVMTEEELRSKGMLDECESRFEENPYSKGFCERITAENERIIKDYQNPQPEISAKDWSEKASLKEYQFCLRSNGIVD